MDVPSTHCGKITITMLRSRLQHLKRVPLPISRSNSSSAISFKAPPDDQMSIVVSEGKLESSGVEVAALPPLRGVAVPEPDPTGPLRQLGSSGGLHHVLNPRGWTIGFLVWPGTFLSGSA